MRVRKDDTGQGLTAAVCLLARDKGEINIAFQMPLYPMLDDRDTQSSSNNKAPVWNTRSNHKAWNEYLRGLEESTPPAYAAPARNVDCSGLPPAYTFVGDIEPFYCETLDYVTNLQNAGIDALVDVYPKWFHAYDVVLPFTKKAKQAIARFEERFQYAVATSFAPQNQ